MKRLLAIILLLPSLAFADCQTIPWPYGVSGTLRFALYEADGATKNNTCADLAGASDILINFDGTDDALDTTTVTDDGVFCSISISAEEATPTSGDSVLINFDDTDTDQFMPFCIRLNTYATSPSGQFQSGSTTSAVVLASGENATDDFYNNRVSVAVTSGTYAGSAACITDYVGSTKTATLSPSLPGAVSSGDDYILLADPNCSANSSISVQSIVDKNCDEALTQNTFGWMACRKGRVD